MAWRLDFEMGRWNYLELLIIKFKIQNEISGLMLSVKEAKVTSPNMFSELS